MRAYFDSLSDPGIDKLAERLARLRTVQRPENGIAPDSEGRNDGGVQYVRARREIIDKRYMDFSIL